MSSQTSTRASKTCPKKTNSTKRQRLTSLARVSRRRPNKETRNSRSSGARGSSKKDNNKLEGQGEPVFFSRTPFICPGHKGRQCILRPQSPVQQAKIILTKRKDTDQPSEQQLKKLRTSEPVTVTLCVFPSLPLVLSLLVQDCYLPHLYQSTIVEQLLGMGVKDIDPSLHTNSFHLQGA